MSLPLISPFFSSLPFAPSPREGIIEKEEKGFQTILLMFNQTLWTFLVKWNFDLIPILTSYVESLAPVLLQMVPERSAWQLFLMIIPATNIIIITLLSSKDHLLPQR